MENSTPNVESVPRGTIGTCELCGVTDHHLVDGLCPPCKEKSETHVPGQQFKWMPPADAR